MICVCVFRAFSIGQFFALNNIRLITYISWIEFLLWDREPISYQSSKNPNLSHYKMMVLNPQRITENDNMILLQNEGWFLSWGYLKGKFHHYQMTLGFYHQVTWSGHSTTTKWKFVFIRFYHQVTWREHFNTTKWRLVFICFYHQVTWRGHSTTINEDVFLIVLYVFIITLLEGNTSEGQLPLLQNEIGFLHVVFRWANSLATKWLSIFQGLSTTETLTTYKMQFPSCGYKMPGPSPFFHLNLSLERPWNGAQGLPFCSWNSNEDTYISSFE